MSKTTLKLIDRMTALQKKHLEAVRWLYTEGPRQQRVLKMKGYKTRSIEIHKNRQRGRSLLIQAVLVEEALAKPGVWIFFQDHYLTNYAAWMNFKTAVMEAKKLRGCEFEFDERTKSFRYKVVSAP